MHVLNNPRALMVLIPLGCVAAFGVSILVGLATGDGQADRTPSAARPAPAPVPAAARPALPAPAPVPAAPPAAAAPAPEPVTEVAEYRLAEDGDPGVRRLLQALLDDPWIRMDPDQRSRFLGAMQRAQRRFDAEMERVFDRDARLAHLPSEERSQELIDGEERAAARIGEELAAELATFLSPEQMRQMRGRVQFRSIMRGFWNTRAIAEVR
jgi:hypothetical protein